MRGFLRGEITREAVLGCINPLRHTHAHIHTCQVQFTALGSGSMAAMSVLESQFRPGLSEEEGAALLVDAITSGILNDMGRCARLGCRVVECAC
jgi:20S proteasome subunit beta 2